MTVRKNDCALVRFGDECILDASPQISLAIFGLLIVLRKKRDFWSLLVTVDGLALGELVGMCT